MNELARMNGSARRNESARWSDSNFTNNMSGNYGEY